MHRLWGRLVCVLGALLFVCALVGMGAGGIEAGPLPAQAERADLRVGTAPPGLLRLPFNGTVMITQGPQLSRCSNIISHYAGAPALDAKALDFGLRYQPVLAVANGKIVEAYTSRNGVVILTLDIGNAYLVHYAHLEPNSWQKFGVGVGSAVYAGQPIATSGKSGTTDPHLHLSSTRSGQPVDLRGMAGLRWFDSYDARYPWDSGKPIVWQGEYIKNCAERLGRNDGVATGAGVQLGGVNLDRWCQRRYGASAALLGNGDALGWRCVNWQWGQIWDIDVDWACREQWAPNAYAKVLDVRNPYSWVCMTP